MRLALIVMVVAAAGCKGKASDASATVGPCDLTGHYRLRFSAAQQRIWFRFRIDNLEGKPVGVLTPPIALDTTNRQLEITPSANVCAFDVAARTDTGPFFARLELDPVANTVKGTIRAEDARAMTRTLKGVRDVGAQKSKLWCIQPGIYELVVPNEQTWTPSNQNQSCDKASLKLPFLVEYVGDDLVLDQLDDKGDAAWAGEDVIETAPCEIMVRFRHYKSYVQAKLVFGGDKVIASATSANVAIEEAGGNWRCETRNPMMWVERRSGRH